MDSMFDANSFKEEITNASEAQASYSYYTHNLTAFRHEMADSGKSYEECEKVVRQCWTNLIESSKRVGYTNGHLKSIAKVLNGNI